MIADTASLLVTLQGNLSEGSSLERLGAWRRGAARGSDIIGGTGGDETGGADAGFLALLYWEEKVLKNETPIRIWRRKKVSVRMLFPDFEAAHLYKANYEGE